MFSIPNFNGDWSTRIQQRYGLDKISYDSFKKKLFDNAGNPQKYVTK